MKHHPLERMSARLINIGNKVVYGTLLKEKMNLLYTNIDREK